jgi:hypothetical protein
MLLPVWLVVMVILIHAIFEKSDEEKKRKEKEELRKEIIEELKQHE